MKQKRGLMLKLVTAVIALVLVLNLNPIPVQAIYVSEIVVEPEVAANQVGTVHTVTAVAMGAGGVVPGVEVYFSVIRGPNAGVNGVSTTDVSGKASFTYTSNDISGIDTISVDSDPSAGYKKFAKKVWLEEPTSGQIETDVFLQSAAEISFVDPITGDSQRNWLTGITVVEVDLGSLGDSDGDGLEEVSAKIIMMDLADSSDHLVITVWSESVYLPIFSHGKIEELTNNTLNVLDIPPFAAGGTAVSTFGFDFKLLLEGGYHFRNIEPVSLAAVIDHKPPEAVTWYNETNPVIHVGGEEIPGPHDMYWHWFVLGDYLSYPEEYISYPEVQLELLPESATNPPGTDHTVTAVYTLDGFPLQGKTIYFVVSGPNAGEQVESVTDAEGEATFTYTGDGGEGEDIIYAGSMLTIGYQDIHATKEWVTTPPPPPPPPPVEVGGEVYPVNKVGVLAPWIALTAAILLISGITLAVRRRRI